MAKIRGRYTTAAGAKRMMLKNGCSNLGEVAARAYPQIPPAFAVTGDWAFVKNPDGSETLGVVLDDKIVSRTPDGLGFVLKAQACAAFRVL